jgi:hypothetical protein
MLLRHCLKLSKILEKMQKEYYIGLEINGGADGTRTRDPRRDRPVF